MWLSGCYNPAFRNTVVDLDEFARAAKPRKGFCMSSPRATVMSAAEHTKHNCQSYVRDFELEDLG